MCPVRVLQRVGKAGISVRAVTKGLRRMVPWHWFYGNAVRSPREEASEGPGGLRLSDRS